ncbi:MAG TPA: histidine phosphatase family protein [Candidatus Microsaccharimonas sp.]|nr:histidine phosphatase family protein [Candidatus Microsaccharimonas sp.]
MKHLYFVRHGLSEANIAGVWSGTMETPLSAEGKRQAKLAGQSAKGLGIDHIICSSLSRAHDTAKIIAEEIGYPVEKIELNSLLLERHFGQMEGQPYQLDADVDGFIDVEARESVLERAKLTLEHLAQLNAQVVLVVSHGSFGRAFRHIITPEIPYNQSDPTTKLANAKLTKFI